MNDFFFFNDTAPTEIYTLSLHDALPIWSSQASWGIEFNPVPPPRRTTAQVVRGAWGVGRSASKAVARPTALLADLDRKSTRLNSSHSQISHVVLCMQKILCLAD